MRFPRDIRCGGGSPAAQRTFLAILAAVAIVYAPGIPGVSADENAESELRASQAEEDVSTHERVKRTTRRGGGG